jgi:hypothetical protein
MGGDNFDGPGDLSLQLPFKAGKKLFRNGPKSGRSFLKSPQAGECQFDSPQDGLDD